MHTQPYLTLRAAVVSALPLLLSSFLFLTMVGTSQASDSLPIISFASDNYSVAEGGSTNITIRLHPPQNGTVQVTYETRVGQKSLTSQANTDYRPIPPSNLTFSPGETEKHITIYSLDDDYVEGDEHFFFDLSQPDGARFESTASSDGQKLTTKVTITDNDRYSLIGFTANGVGVNENETVDIGVFHVPSRSYPVTVQYYFANGTATAGVDYVAPEVTTLTFAPGETRKYIDITGLADNEVEDLENFRIILANPRGGAFNPYGGNYYTVKDEPRLWLDVKLRDTTAGLSFTNYEVVANEGEEAVFHLRLARPHNRTLHLKYSTVPETAQWSDFGGHAQQNLTFAPGETKKTIRIPVSSDNVSDDNETFLLSVNGADGGVGFIAPHGYLGNNYLETEFFARVTIRNVAPTSSLNVGSLPQASQIPIGLTLTARANSIEKGGSVIFDLEASQARNASSTIQVRLNGSAIRRVYNDTFGLLVRNDEGRASMLVNVTMPANATQTSIAVHTRADMTGLDDFIIAEIVGWSQPAYSLVDGAYIQRVQLTDSETSPDNQTKQPGLTNQTSPDNQTNQPGLTNQTSPDNQTKQPGLTNQTSPDNQTKQPGLTNQTSPDNQTNQPGLTNLINPDNQTSPDNQTKQPGLTNQTSPDNQTKQPGPTNQTSPASPEVVPDLPTARILESAEMESKVNTLLLPHFAAAIMDEAIHSIAGRVRGMLGNGDSPARQPSFTVKGMTLTAFAQNQARREDAELPWQNRGDAWYDQLSLHDLAFAGDSGKQRQASVWAQGFRRQLEGDDANVSFDGEIPGGMLGVDVAVNANTILGLGVSTADADFTYADSRADMGGQQTANLRAIHPYFGWRNAASQIWGSAALGSGESDMTMHDGTGADMGNSSRQADLDMRGIALGFSTSLNRQAQHAAQRTVMHYNLIGDISLARLDKSVSDSEAQAKINAMVVDSGAARLGVAYESSRSRADGSRGMRRLSLAIRHDLGDSDQGTGLELDGGLAWRGANGLMLDLTARTLLSNDSNASDWGVRGIIAWQSAAAGDGEGLRVTFSPQWSRPPSIPSDQHDHGGDKFARYIMDVRYGMRVVRNALLTPFVTGEVDDLDYGVNFQSDSGFTARLKYGDNYNYNGGVDDGYRAFIGFERRF